MEDNNFSQIAVYLTSGSGRLIAAGVLFAVMVAFKYAPSIVPNERLAAWHSALMGSPLKRMGVALALAVIPALATALTTDASASDIITTLVTVVFATMLPGASAPKLELPQVGKATAGILFLACLSSCSPLAGYVEQLESSAADANASLGQLEEAYEEALSEAEAADIPLVDAAFDPAWEAHDDAYAAWHAARGEVAKAVLAIEAGHEPDVKAIAKAVADLAEALSRLRREVVKVIAEASTWDR